MSVYKQATAHNAVRAKRKDGLLAQTQNWESEDLVSIPILPPNTLYDLKTCSLTYASICASVKWV